MGISVGITVGPAVGTAVMGVGATVGIAVGPSVGLVVGICVGAPHWLAGIPALLNAAFERTALEPTRHVRLVHESNASDTIVTVAVVNERNNVCKEVQPLKACFPMLVATDRDALSSSVEPSKALSFTVVAEGRFTVVRYRQSRKAS